MTEGVRTFADALRTIIAHCGDMRPRYMVMSEYGHAAFHLSLKAEQQAWDRRRLKRELRKGNRSVYSKAALDG